MNESHDARLAKAAMRSLRVSAPESLRADLRRLARARRSAPSFWDDARGFLLGGAWEYGAGAAFAAAGIGIFMLRAVPEPAASLDAARRPAHAAAAPQALQDLWSDDDGGDDEEI
ncbi:MAG: hypothetical protein HY403_05785 [Elusimicrobia bacterium]|nr:hypothetical protein [Elusimicrobiota bacterium]